MIEKSEGYKVELVLPSVTNSAKVLKKLAAALPKGTVIELSTTDRTINPRKYQE